MKSKTIHTYLLAILVLSTLSFSGCITYPQTDPESKAPGRQLPPPQYFTDEDGDGTFDPIQLEENPEPRQGKEQWVRDFYGSIKYPASARENAIQGIVMLEVLIDETGIVQEVNIKEKVSKDCDEEAKRAFLYATQQGFTPLIRNGVAVKFKMETGILFSLK
jgi:TonB family protein